MSELLADFERDCAQAGLKPTAVLKAAGVHTSLWWKWKADKASPTLRNFEAVRRKLDELSPSSSGQPSATDDTAESLAARS